MAKKVRVKLICEDEPQSEVRGIINRDAPQFVIVEASELKKTSFFPRPETFWLEGNNCGFPAEAVITHVYEDF